MNRWEIWKRIPVTTEVQKSGWFSSSLKKHVSTGKLPLYHIEIATSAISDYFPNQYFHNSSSRFHLTSSFLLLHLLIPSGTISYAIIVSDCLILLILAVFSVVIAAITAGFPWPWYRESSLLGHSSPGPHMVLLCCKGLHNPIKAFLISLWKLTICSAQHICISFPQLWSQYP